MIKGFCQPGMLFFDNIICSYKITILIRNMKIPQHNKYFGLYYLLFKSFRKNNKVQLNTVKEFESLSEIKKTNNIIRMNINM